MPVLDGLEVQTVLHRNGPMNPRLAVRVIEQAAAALEAAHEAGLVHTDFRPSNLFVVAGEFVYLIDFGVAAHTPVVPLPGQALVEHPPPMSSFPPMWRSTPLPTCT